MAVDFELRGGSDDAAPTAPPHSAMAAPDGDPGSLAIRLASPRKLLSARPMATNRAAPLITTGATGGPSWVASIVDAVGTSKCKNPDGSSYWDSTAIIITWDDWGGWYDHEPPRIEPYPQGGYQKGFRVPLIVVSAYAQGDCQQFA